MKAGKAPNDHIARVRKMNCGQFMKSMAMISPGTTL